MAEVREGRDLDSKPLAHHHCKKKVESSLGFHLQLNTDQG